MNVTVADTGSADPQDFLVNFSQFSGLFKVFAETRRGGGKKYALQQRECIFFHSILPSRNRGLNTT